MNKKFTVVLIFSVLIVFVLIHKADAQAKKWTGNGDGVSWSNSANWTDNILPSASDSVVLDNSIVNDTFTVNISSSAVVVRKLVIDPTSSNTKILLILSNSGNPGLTVGNAIAGDYDLIIERYATLRNSSTAAAGSGLFLATTDSLRLNFGAKYIHNTNRANAAIVAQLSKAPGTEFGEFHFDVPTTGSYSPSLSGRNFGTLRLSSSAAGGTKRYTSSGAGSLTIRGYYFVDTGVIDTSTMTGTRFFGNIINNFGTIYYPAQKIVFNGSGTQSNFGNVLNLQRCVEITNPGGLDLNTDMKTDTLILNGGIITTDISKVTVGRSASITGNLIRISGHINGKLERFVPPAPQPLNKNNINSPDAALITINFPLGNTTTYQPVDVGINALPLSGGSLIVSNTVGNNGSDLSVPLNDGGFTINRRSNMYWTLTSAFTDFNYDLTIDANGQNGITSSTDLRLIYSNDLTNFSLVGTHLNGSGNIASRISIPGTVNGSFFIGGNTLINPLPVELSGLTASSVRNDVFLKWITTYEHNNSRFEIERANSVNGNLNYIKVGSLEGSGNSDIQKLYSYKDANVPAGKYSYRLKQVDFNGNIQYYLLNNEIEINLPGKFSLSQNYPNPFNPTTKISYEIAAESKITLNVFDASGREIRSLVSKIQNAGYYEVNMNASDLGSGVYYFRLNAVYSNGSFDKTLKMMLVK